MPLSAWSAQANSLAFSVDQTRVAGSALTNTTTETIISPSSPDFTFMAGFPELSLGQMFWVRAFGVYSSTGTPALTLQLRYGGTGGVSLLTTGAVTTQSGVTNTAWMLDALLSVRTLGASGTIWCQGYTLGIAGAATAALLPATAPAVSTVDTTAQKSLTLTGTWGAASASNTITCHLWLVEALC